MKRPASEMSPGVSNEYPERPPRPEPIETTDVLVVGAGPAGLMLACVTLCPRHSLPSDKVSA
jgi:NADPH-dependent 2,4-dienoyl-CoA reductase/sulfur reductase-like enzyme